MRAGLIKGMGQTGQGDREIPECISARWAMFGVQLHHFQPSYIGRNTDADKHSFLNGSYQVAVDTLIHTWGPEEEFGTAF